MATVGMSEIPQVFGLVDEHFEVTCKQGLVSSGVFFPRRTYVNT